jgi:hypothetical protein
VFFPLDHFDEMNFLDTNEFDSVGRISEKVLGMSILYQFFHETYNGSRFLKYPPPSL